jgi:hypothetical protein
MMTVHELSLGGEAQAAESNGDELKIPKEDGFTGEKSSHDKCSLSVAVASANDGTIRTSRGKVLCKSPFPARQRSVFFAPVRYRVVKIVHSNSEVVLQAMKNYKAHYSLS